MQGNALTVNRSENAIIHTGVSRETFQRFIDFLDVKPKTAQTYTRALRQFWNFLSERSNTTPNRDDVIAYREMLKENDYKPSTIQNYIIAVRQFFKWTASEGIYPNVADKVKGAKLENTFKRDYLHSEQVKNLLAHIDRSTLTGKRDYAILSLMVTGGLRTIEVSRARIEDLRPLGDMTVLYVLGKGRDERSEYVKVCSFTESAIRDYLSARGERNEKAPLFVSTSNNSKDKALSTRTVSGIVKEHLLESGYNSSRLTAHSLRHTAVTLALLAGASMEEAQQFARHKNITTTQVYAHHLDREKNRCSSMIEKAIF